MSNVLKHGNVIKLVGLAADPGSAENGSIFYRTDTNKIRQYLNGAWVDISAGSVSLTGQILNDGEIIVGNVSNLSAAIDTDTVGDVQADHVAGLTIKSGVIVNAQVSSSAAIARSKLASGTADRVVTNNGSGVMSELALTSGQIIVGSVGGVPTAVAVSGDLTLAASGDMQIASGAIVNADVNASAAIAHSKLATATPGQVLLGNGSSVVTATTISGDATVSGTGDLQISAGAVVNADINASAAIAFSKMAALTASKVAVTDGSGVVSTASYAPGDVILRTGVVPFTGNQDLGGFKITGSASPTAATDLANKAYVDATAEGLKPKAAVRVATTANLNLALDLENLDVVDGITLATGNRVLVKDQTTTSQNGIYVVQASGAAVRATDFDSVSPIDEINGAYTSVQEGSANAGKLFVQSGTVVTLGTDAINFVFFNSISGLVGGDMIAVSGSNISVDLAAVSGLESSNPGNSAGQLRVKLEVSTPSLQIDGSNQLGAKLDAAGTITSGASGLSVGVDNSTIEKSTNTLRLKDLGITDAKVAAAAAIARTKLASGTANRMVVNDGSGVMSDAAAITAARALISDVNGIPTHSAVTSTELGYVSGVTSALQTQIDGKASTALNNLAAVAINTSLISDTNNTDDLGSDAIEWKDAYVHRVLHNDATNPNLTVETSGNNGSLIQKAHGTGSLDQQVTKRRLSEGYASSSFMEEQYLDAISLLDAQTAINVTSLQFAHASFEGLLVKYKIKEATSNRVRIGELSVVTNGTDVSIVDSNNENADVGVSWTAAIVTTNVEVRYTTTTTTNIRTMRAIVQRIRA